MLLPMKGAVVSAAAITAIVDTAAMTSTTVHTPIDWIFQNLAIFVTILAAAVAYGSLKQKVNNQSTACQDNKQNIAVLAAKIELLASTMTTRVEAIAERKVSREELLTITGHLQSQMSSLHADLGHLVKRLDGWMEAR